MTDSGQYGETVEPTLTLDDGTEVTVRLGFAFKEGTIAVQVYDRRGDGASAYLSPDEATVVRDALTKHLDGEEFVTVRREDVQRVVAALDAAATWGDEGVLSGSQARSLSALNRVVIGRGQSDA